MTAAIAATKAAVPDISDREAMLKAVAAVHYASWRIRNGFMRSINRRRGSKRQHQRASDLL
jgi:hypothetical protein